jgi:hypothetical protein
MKYLLLILFTLAGWGLEAQQSCQTPPVVNPIPAELIAAADLNIDYCIDWFFEVRNDMYVRKGGLSGVREYTEKELDDVVQLYADNGITLNYEVHYWDTPDPYTGTSSSSYLNSFRQNHLPHTADGSMLLSFDASGGIAWVDVLCNGNYGYAFSSLTEFQGADYPAYSWNVMVISHEMGHNLGSPHTHACAWNGNATAIDACAGGVEGNCPNPNPASPPGGGTVMSYCHFTTGINFMEGFGEQPLNLIKNRIAGAGCTDCTDNPPPPPPPGGEDDCTDNIVLLEIIFDNYPTETEWAITDQNDTPVAIGGPYPKNAMNTYHADTFCLVDGCYKLTVYDPDGLAGYGCGEGAFTLMSGTVELGSGMAFTDSTIVEFCLNAAPPEAPCEEITIANLIPHSNQDMSNDASISSMGTLTLEGNTWKAMDHSYTVTPNTVLQLDFKSIREGEIHAIGLARGNANIQRETTVQFYGTQYYGIQNYNAYDPVYQFWQETIPIGTIFEDLGKLGDYSHLVFINDMDRGTRDAHSQFRNVYLCENEGLAKSATLPGKSVIMGTEEEVAFWPNPATDTLYFNGVMKYTIMSVVGRRMLSGKADRVDIRKLPTGIYFLGLGGQAKVFVKR